MYYHLCMCMQLLCRCSLSSENSFPIILTVIFLPRYHFPQQGIKKLSGNFEGSNCHSFKKLSGLKENLVSYKMRKKQKKDPLLDYGNRHKGLQKSIISRICIYRHRNQALMILVLKNRTASIVCLLGMLSVVEIETLIPTPRLSLFSSKKTTP